MEKNFQKIIVRMPNWLGDFVMALPILTDLRKQFPEAKITAMCLSQFAQLLEENPYVTEILPFKKARKRDALRQLRNAKYDLGVLLTNSFSSAFWFWRGGVRKRLGFSSEGRRLFLTRSPSFPTERGKEHIVITYKRLLASLGIGISDTVPKLFLSEKDQLEAKDLLKAHGYVEGAKIVGINPGAAYGSAKCWLPERFRAVAEKLLKDPEIFVVYFGDAQGTSLVNGICEKLPERTINLAGKTSLRQLMALIGICDAFLTNDSGPMHIAAALKTPLLALFGSTNDTVTGPYLHGQIIHKRVDCSPCYLRTCPIDFRCMKQIEDEEVYHELLKILKL